MDEKRNQLCKQIAAIIHNFRVDEIDNTLDDVHVGKWVEQFSEESQEVILFETAHILSDWYFSRERIETDFLDKIESFLVRKYKYDSVQTMLEETSFVKVQEVGQSQKKLVNMMTKLMDDRYRYNVNTDTKSNYKHFVYIDDGIYSGSRIRKDIKELLNMCSLDSTLDVFVIVAGTQSFSYSLDILKPIALERRCSLSFYRAFPLYNNHTTKRSDDGGYDFHDITQTCLWPDHSLSSVKIIQDYQESLDVSDRQKYYLYRNAPWNNDKGIFTSVKNRNIVEKEFLMKGIKLLNRVGDNKGLYPLGYNVFPSLGYGSFCATDLNISNTCPLVLWWSLDWYPLLPRRANGVEDSAKLFDFDDFDSLVNHNTDQYNMCPDCGEYFGLETDGGNGFCIKCAWKH